MVDVAKRLTHRIVDPAFGGSRPLIHPDKKRRTFRSVFFACAPGMGVISRVKVPNAAGSGKR